MLFFKRVKDMVNFIHSKIEGGSLWPTWMGPFGPNVLGPGGGSFVVVGQ